MRLPSQKIKGEKFVENLWVETTGEDRNGVIWLGQSKKYREVQVEEAFCEEIEKSFKA